MRRGSGVRSSAAAVAVCFSLVAVLAATAAAGPPGPQITSSPAAATTDTSATFAFSADLKKDEALSCTLDGGGWQPCSSPVVYSGLSLGSHQFSVAVAKKGKIDDKTTTSYSWTIDPVLPVNTSAPTISGVAQVGQTLTASSGAWSGTAPISYSYQWLRCDATGANCTDIAGATSSTAPSPPPRSV